MSSVVRIHYEDHKFERVQLLKDAGWVICGGAIFDEADVEDFTNLPDKIEKGELETTLEKIGYKGDT